MKCYVAFRVHLCETRLRDIVPGFKTMHMHDLVLNFQYHLIPSNRQVPDRVLATDVPLHRVGVKTSRIMDLFVEQRGWF